MGMPFHDWQNEGTKTQVRDKVAIHHINMNPVSASLLQSLDLLAETGKIGRKDRWGNDQTHSVASKAVCSKSTSSDRVSCNVTDSGLKCRSVCIGLPVMCIVK